MKIIITGSREWADSYAIDERLHFTFAELFIDEVLTVVHGDCPTGADYIAHLWCQRMKGYPVIEKKYPADWAQFGKPAGHIRNHLMINENLDADAVFAFPIGESPGTRGCMKYAHKVGLRVLNMGDE